MNPWEGRTPEERRAMVQKGIETRRRNREDRVRELAGDKEARDGLKGEIARLEAERNALVLQIELCTVANSLSGHSLLTEAEIVGSSEPWGLNCGVYFLVKGGRIVYVGQSVNVFSRIAYHANCGYFDTFAWVKCDKSTLDRLESLYIHVFKPPMNGNGGPEGSKTAPIKLADLLRLSA